MSKYSKSGYKRKSEDKENSFNMINSNHITMKNVDFPVLGIDNLGNTKVMKPGAHYIFPGNEVFEVPLKTGDRKVAQEGTEVVGREGVRYNNPGVDDSHSTHVMAHEFVEGVGWVAFPTLFQVPTEDGKMEWVDLTKEAWVKEGNVKSEWNWNSAYQYAKRLNEVYEFGYGDEALKKAEEFAVDGYKNKQKGGSLPKAQGGKEFMADMQVQAMLQEAGYDTQLSDLRNYQGGTDGPSFEGFAKAIGIYDNLYENKSRLNQFVRNIWPAIQFTFRQAAVMDLDGLPGGRNNLKSPWETDFVTWDESKPLLNKEYDIQNLVLDLTAIVFPAADVAHGFEQIGRGNYVNGALFMLFGIIPGTAGPLVDAIAPKLGALSDMAKGSPKTFKQNEAARKLAREIENAIKESDKTGIKIDSNFKGPNINPATVGKIFNIDNLPSQQPTSTTAISGKKITQGNPNNKNWWYQTDEAGDIINKQNRYLKDENFTSNWKASQTFADEPFKRQVSIFMDNNKDFKKLKEVARISKNNPNELFVNKQQLKSYITGNVDDVASLHPLDKSLVNKTQKRTKEQQEYLLNIFEQNYGNLGKYDAISLNEFKDLTNANMIDLKNFKYDKHPFEKTGANYLNYNNPSNYDFSVIGVTSDALTKKNDFFSVKNMPAHSLNQNTLGHSRIMVDKNNPQVLNVLEQQSDWATKKFRTEFSSIKNNYNEQISKYHNITKEVNGQNVKVKLNIDNPTDRERLKEVFFAGKSKVDGTNLYSTKLKELEDIFLKYDQQKANYLSKIDGPIGGQGVSLGKNYDRYGFQQNIKYALDNNHSIIRYPTVETSMKIQGHDALSLPTNVDDWIKQNPRIDPNRPFNEFMDMSSHNHKITTVVNDLFTSKKVTIPNNVPGGFGGTTMFSAPALNQKVFNETMDYGSMYGFKFKPSTRESFLRNKGNVFETGTLSNPLDGSISTYSSSKIGNKYPIIAKSINKKELTEKARKKYQKIIQEQYNGNEELFIGDLSDKIRRETLDKYYKKLNRNPKKSKLRESNIIFQMNSTNRAKQVFTDDALDLFIKQPDKEFVHIRYEGEFGKKGKKLNKNQYFEQFSYDNLTPAGKEQFDSFAKNYENIYFEKPLSAEEYSSFIKSKVDEQFNFNPDRKPVMNSRGEIIGETPNSVPDFNNVEQAAREWQIEAGDEIKKQFDEIFDINLYSIDADKNLTYIDPADYEKYQNSIHKKNVEYGQQAYEIDLPNRIDKADNYDSAIKAAKKQLNRGDEALAIMSNRNIGVHTTYQNSNFEKMVKESLGEDYVQYISQYTDEAGNTWNQLDLPDDVLSGKVEIRGMQTGGEISEKDLNKFKNNAENNPAWLNNRLRTSVTPMGFKNASEEMVQGKRKQNDKWDNLDENAKNMYNDSWLKYLGYEQKNQTFKASNYRKDDDQEYVQFSNEDDIYKAAMSDKESDLEFNRRFDSKVGLPYISYSKSYNPNLPLVDNDAGKPYEIYGKMYYDPSTKDSKGSPIRISDDAVSSYAIKEDDMKAGLQHVESNDGEKKYNEKDSKAGRYGQQFDDVKNKYKGSKEDFSKDEKAQDDTFRERYSGNFNNEKGLEQSGYDLYQSNKDVANELGYTPKEMAALSYLLGEEGAQRYLTNKLTGEKTVQELFPEMYKDKLKNTTLLPADYVESFKEGVQQYRQMQWDYILNLVTKYGEQNPQVKEVLNRFGSSNTEEKEKKGGEITKEKRKNNRLQQQLIKYKKGNSISPLAKRELESMGLI